MSGSGTGLMDCRVAFTEACLGPAFQNKDVSNLIHLPVPWVQPREGFSTGVLGEVGGRWLDIMLSGCREDFTVGEAQSCLSL